MDIQKAIETELLSVLDSLCHGDVCPLETVLRYRQQVEVYERLKKSVIFGDAVESALRKYGKDKYKAITISYRRTYNYAVCGDCLLEELEAKQDEAAASVKARREFLQKLSQSVFDMDGIEIKPPAFKVSRIIEVANATAKKQTKYV
jgi:hypothetical protein